VIGHTSVVFSVQWLVARGYRLQVPPRLWTVLGRTVKHYYCIVMNVKISKYRTPVLEQCIVLGVQWYCSTLIK
jgi:hypothetical protein